MGQKRKSKKFGVLISIIIGMLIIFGLNLNYSTSEDLIKFSHDARDMIYFIFVVAICGMIYQNLNNLDVKYKKRLWVISIIVGILFAIMYYLGDLQTDYITETMPLSLIFILFSFIKLVTYFAIFTNAVVWIFNQTPKIIEKFEKKDNESKFSKFTSKFFTNNKKSFWILTLVFFISYIPFFLHYFPGNISPDGYGTIAQIYGLEAYNNKQPLLYTFMLGGFFKIGKEVFGNVQLGFAMQSILQMIATSLAFSGILYYMAKRGISLRWRIVTFLLLLLNPINGWSVVRIEKGILFHISLIWTILGIIDIMYEKEDFFKKWWKPVGFILISLFMIFIRNNGIYSIILTLPFLILACNKIWKQILLLFGIVLIISMTIQGPIFRILNIKYSYPGEFLSVPLQEIIRVYKYRGDRLSDEDKENIQRYFKTSIDDISQNYLPWISDNVKSQLNEDEFEKDKIGLIKLYIKFAIKFPEQAIQSLVYNTGANYSPNFNAWTYVNIYGEESYYAFSSALDGINDIAGFDKKPLVNITALDRLNTVVAKQNIPVFTNILTNIGFYFWLLVLLIAYCIYEKQYRYIVMTIPILALWATSIVAPCVDIRYIYAMFIAVPIYMGIVGTEFFNKSEKINLLR